MWHFFAEILNASRDSNFSEIMTEILSEVYVFTQNRFDYTW